MPASARTTIIPLKNTARFAVAPAAPTASSFSRPRCRSSRYRDNDEQGVVDPDREPHHRDQVRSEEAESPHLAEQSRHDPEGHRDGEDRHDDRGHARDHRPEHDRPSTIRRPRLRRIPPTLRMSSSEIRLNSSKRSRAWPGRVSNPIRSSPHGSCRAHRRARWRVEVTAEHHAEQYGIPVIDGNGPRAARQRVLRADSGGEVAIADARSHARPRGPRSRPGCRSRAPRTPGPRPWCLRRPR